MEVEDGLSSPTVLEPPVAGDQGVVLVGQAVAVLPVVELAGGDPEPGDEARDGDLGALGPVADVSRRRRRGCRGEPRLRSEFPKLFF